MIGHEIGQNGAELIATTCICHLKQTEYESTISAMISANSVDTSAMEPLLPSGEKLAEAALVLVREASELGGQLHPTTRKPWPDLLRTIKTSHSTLIKPPHPPPLHT